MDNKNILQQVKKNIKLWWEMHESDVFVIAIAVLLSVVILGAGRLYYEIESRKILTRFDLIIEENAFPVLPPSAVAKNFMASVNGEKYYPMGCKAANRIKQENRVWFSSGQEAREMGYTPSVQC